MATKNKESLQCSICEKEFTKKWSTPVTRHRRVVHAYIKKFECLWCEATFGYSWTLRQHQSKVHGSGQFFICDDCKKSVPSQRKLQAASP